MYIQKQLHMRQDFLLHGRYRIGGVIDESDTDAIYLAWDMLLERRVSVREYLPKALAVRIFENMEVGVAGKDAEQQFQDGCARFTAEAAHLAAYKEEPEVVEILDSFADNNTSYIIMEYLEGITLERYLRQKNNIVPERSVRLLASVISLLEALYREDVYWGITPQDILVTKSGKIKLVRFPELVREPAVSYVTREH